MYEREHVSHSVLSGNMIVKTAGSGSKEGLALPSAACTLVGTYPPHLHPLSSGVSFPHTYVARGWCIVVFLTSCALNVVAMHLHALCRGRVGVSDGYLYFASRFGI